MANDETGQEQQPGEPPVEISQVEEVPTADDDTEGHSLLTIELGGTIERDRVRETEKAGRDRARAREARSKDDGGFLKRFRRG